MSKLLYYIKNKRLVMKTISEKANAVIMTDNKNIYNILKKYLKPVKTSETTIHLDRDIIHDILLGKKVNYFIYNDNNYKMDIVLHTKLILI